jgi:MFS family permease
MTTSIVGDGRSKQKCRLRGIGAAGSAFAICYSLCRKRSAFAYPTGASPYPGDPLRPKNLMAFAQSDTLVNRSFVGLIIAQFLAGFNDQAIHASAMFYAIHQGILTEAQAISLMPILFYAPWAIFCTLAGYLADRFSKRHSLVVWKIAEVGIALVALAGFWIGGGGPGAIGPWMVMACVFLMGTHAAFFAPAKYGAMPEILEPQVLSRGNGILESTTFLAAILGTVAGGLLSAAFRGDEIYIGLILLGLGVVGAAASFMIAVMPPANPQRLFPRNLLKPLLDNLRLMVRSKPLALSVLGIAFFIFMVAYMRSTMYMHGQTRNPRWDEFKTSLIVATVALGVGLGSPLAGFLSGGKVELGLVPLGAVGMIAGALVAAFTIHLDTGLILSLIVLGFFSGFYMVPLYTLLQHRAPKTSKGDLIATSNFINVTGAIAASLLFYLLVLGAHATGLAPEVPQKDRIAEGVLAARPEYKHGRPVKVVVETPGWQTEVFRARTVQPERDDEPFERIILDTPVDDDLFEVGSGLQQGDRVIVSSYHLRGAKHFRVRPADQPLMPAFDNDGLPRFLFIGAAVMTLGILILLCRQLPDFFVRALLWVRSRSRYRLSVVGMNNLPTDGPVILATNCDRFEDSMQVVAATDRFTRFILLEDPADRQPTPLLRYLARRTGMVVLHAGSATTEDWEKARTKALRTLATGDLLALTLDGRGAGESVDKFLAEIRAESPAPVVPVYCDAPGAGLLSSSSVRGLRKVRVVIGRVARPGATVPEIRQSLEELGDWIHATDHGEQDQASAKIPAGAGASPKPTAESHPPHPSAS